MHARVMQFQIVPGKVNEFAEAVRSIAPLANQQKGFRGFIALHTREKTPIEVETISLWDSLDDLDASEKNLYLYEALARLQSFAQGFPRIQVYQVLARETPPV
ncbi:MAG: antibiotic biosynthesis monooxygenase family protein [Candidatus Acidiferrales bacterium]